MTRWRTIPGINIQWPWSQLIASGQKTVETRSYPIPEKHIGRDLAIIETPGPNGHRAIGLSEARIIGIVRFSGSFRYKSKAEWLRDKGRHCVDESDPLFRFKSDQPKYGWVVEQVSTFPQPKPAPAKRGIIFAAECEI